MAIKLYKLFKAQTKCQAMIAIGDNSLYIPHNCVVAMRSLSRSYEAASCPPCGSLHQPNEAVSHHLPGRSHANTDQQHSILTYLFPRWQQRGSTLSIHLFEYSFVLFWVNIGTLANNRTDKEVIKEKYLLIKLRLDSLVDIWSLRSEFWQSKAILYLNFVERCVTALWKMGLKRDLCLQRISHNLAGCSADRIYTTFWNIRSRKWLQRASTLRNCLFHFEWTSARWQIIELTKRW